MWWIQAANDIIICQYLGILSIWVFYVGMQYDTHVNVIVLHNPSRNTTDGFSCSVDTRISQADHQK